VIPVNTDPTGVWGEPGETTHLYGDFALQDLIHYMVKKGGGTPIIHGYTHQHDTNSGIDYEFWNGRQNNPYPEDAYDWALGRIDAGIAEFEKGLEYPRSFGKRPIILPRPIPILHWPSASRWSMSA